MPRRLGIGWKVGFWAAAGAILIFLLWLFEAVLLPFVMAIVVSYLLDPFTNKLEKVGLKRSSAVSIILAVAIVTVVIVLTVFAPMVVRQVSEFIKALPQLVDRAQDLVASLAAQFSQGRGSVLLAKLGLNGGSISDFKGYTTDITNKGVAWMATFANSLLSRGAALLDLFSLLIITPVVGFYMLLDWRKMIAMIDGLVPPRNRNTVRAIAHDIDLALAGFMRGQSLVCLFLAVWYGIGLTMIGLNFGLLIGIIGGVLSFVPYVGSLVVLVLASLVAVVQGWPSWHLPAFAIAVVLVGQFLEGNVLSPKLVGDKVGLHPIWIIFALFAFSSVGGFTGLIIAVPVAAAIGVLLRFATRRYRESPIYTGEIASTQVTMTPVSSPTRLSGTG